MIDSFLILTFFDTSSAAFAELYPLLIDVCTAFALSVSSLTSLMTLFLSLCKWNDNLLSI